MNDRRLPLLVNLIAHRAVLVPVPDLRLAEAVQLPSADGIKVNGESEGDEEADEGDDHGDVVIAMVGHEAGERGEQGAAADRGHDPGGPAFGVPAQTADREREDGGEDGGFEEEDYGQDGHAAFSLDAHGCCDEDHDHRHEEHEDPAGLDEHHAAGGEEPADGE